jgi:quinol monooxygenase YgiN
MDFTAVPDLYSSQPTVRRWEMRHVMVRYKVKPDRVAENEELVREVYDDLQRSEPGGFRYATFRLDDGVSFLHVASIEAEDGQSPLPDMQAFRRFQENLGDRCDEPPVVTEVSEIGSFPRFGD